MSIDATTATTTSPTTDPAAAVLSNPKNELGQDAFMQLLVTQLQHQDPTQPQDDQQLIAQLAQFSSLEKLTTIDQSMTSMNQSMTKLLQAVSPASA